MIRKKVVVISKKHILGTTHTNTFANKNGLDELDLWAAGIGQATKNFNLVRCKPPATKKHLLSCSNFS